jgi:hypothetical protein
MKQVIIGQEEKPRESQSLRVQIFVQPLLDAINHVIALLKVLVESSLQT